MFTTEQLELIKTLTTSTALGVFERDIMLDILNSNKKPQIIVTIEDGSFQFAYANMDIELVVADIDNIKLGDDLYYPALTGETQEEFDEAVQKVYEQIIFQKAKDLKDEPVNSVRIFIHDHEDQFPFNVMVDDEVIATYKTFPEAFTFLQEYLEARKQ